MLPVGHQAKLLHSNAEIGAGSARFPRASSQNAISRATDLAYPSASRRLSQIAAPDTRIRNAKPTTKAYKLVHDLLPILTRPNYWRRLERLRSAGLSRQPGDFGRFADRYFAMRLQPVSQNLIPPPPSKARSARPAGRAVTRRWRSMRYRIF